MTSIKAPTSTLPEEPLDSVNFHFLCNMPDKQKDNPQPTQKKIEKEINGTSGPSTSKPKNPSLSDGEERNIHDGEDDMSMIQPFKPDERK